jgi:hypothetical protein
VTDRAPNQEGSSLDIEAGPGSQGEQDPGSEGDFTGTPMGEPMDVTGGDLSPNAGTDDADEPPQPGG